MCPEQDCENLVYHFDQTLSMIEALKLDDTHEWRDSVKAFHAWYDKTGSKSQKEAWTWEGKGNQRWCRGSSKRSQSVRSFPAEREDPCEQGLAWRDIGPANIEESFLYPPSDIECPVVQQQVMDMADQQKYMVWIEKVLDLDRRTAKDERLYCGYCDMNNHPRFSCKHFKKHRTKMLHIGVHCAFPCMLRSNVQEPNAMEDAQSRIGLISSSNLQKRNVVLQISTGTRKSSTSSTSS